MNDFLQTIGVAPETLPVAILLSSAILFFLYKRYILNIFDPIVMYLIGMVADATLVFALPWETALKWEYTLFSGCVLVGFAISSRRPSALQALKFRKGSLYDLEGVLWALFIIVVVANLVLGASTGFPLLSANPSSAKVTAYSGGIGLVRRINLGPYLFFSCGCVFLAFLGFRRRLALGMLFCSSVFIALSGSKGALLSLVYTQALLLGHPGVGKSPRVKAKIRRYMAYTLFAGLIVALAVTTRDTGSVSSGMLALLQRMLLAGDAVLFYFGGRERVLSMSTRSLAGFWSYLSNDTLAMLRLADYQESLGSVILGSGNNGFGPNAQYFVVADLFFGPIGGCIYSLLIGYLIGKLRSMFLNASGSSAVVFVLKLTLAVSAFNLIWESAMYAQIIATILIAVFPLWVVVRFIRRPQRNTGRDPNASSSLLLGLSRTVNDGEPSQPIRSI